MTAAEPIVGAGLAMVVVGQLELAFQIDHTGFQRANFAVFGFDCSGGDSDTCSQRRNLGHLAAMVGL